VTPCGVYAGDVAIVTVSGPKDAGPGEREQMLDRAVEILGEDVLRIDVPARGTASDGDGRLRDAVHGIVPALQSGSLFGDTAKVMVVDAQQLLKAEAEVIAELIASIDADAVEVVFVAAGTIPAPLAKTLKAGGETITVKKLRERDAAQWLGRAAKERKLRIDSDAAHILLQRFGTDVAALGRALDQLAVEGPSIDAAMVRNRFTNRPEEPVWLLSDAIVAGKEGEALRRLEDYLEHGHPLALLSFLEGEVRRRSLAQVAPDVETYAAWVGSTPTSYPVRKAWDARNRTRSANLARSLDAIARADVTLKTAPEAVHRVTLERLTVALSRWLSR